MPLHPNARAYLQAVHAHDRSLQTYSDTGISSGTAHTIGALLFAELGRWNLLDLRRLRFRKHRTVAGVRCVCVSGIHPRSGRLSAWPGAKDMPLRRLLDSRLGAEELRTIPSAAPTLTPQDFAAPGIAP